MVRFDSVKGGGRRRAQIGVGLETARRLEALLHTMRDRRVEFEASRALRMRDG